MSWESIITYAGISAVFGWLRTWLSPQKTRRIQYFISAMVSIPVGIVFGFLTEGLGFQQGVVFAVVAASALIAENIINVVVEFGDKFEQNPIGTIRRIRNLKDK